MPETTIARPSGGDGTEGPRTTEEMIDEASMESFPCSDPPAFNVVTLGPPPGRFAPPAPVDRVPLAKSAKVALVALAVAGVAVLAVARWRR